MTMTKIEAVRYFLNQIMQAVGTEPEAIEGMDDWAMANVAFEYINGDIDDANETAFMEEDYFVVRAYSRSELQELVDYDLSGLSDDELDKVASLAGQKLSFGDEFAIALEAAVEELHPDLDVLDDDDEEICCFCGYEMPTSEGIRNDDGEFMCDDCQDADGDISTPLGLFGDEPEKYDDDRENIPGLFDPNTHKDDMCTQCGRLLMWPYGDPAGAPSCFSCDKE